MPVPIDNTGQRFGRLLVTGRNEAITGGQYNWLCLCDCGNVSSVQGQKLRSGKIKSCGCLRRDLLTKPDHEIGYVAAHERVRKAKGKASEHKCVDCGAEAREWSLRQDAARTYLVKVGRATCRISGDPADYEPRCLSCHRIYDSGFAKETRSVLVDDPGDVEVT